MNKHQYVMQSVWAAMLFLYATLSDDLSPGASGFWVVFACAYWLLMYILAGDRKESSRGAGE